jgi:hypothetical protein
MPNLLSTLIVLFAVLVLSVMVIQNVIVPAIVNYQHGIFNSPDFTIDKSKLQGLGLFSKRIRVKGERLFEAINANKKVTPIGRKINHCPGKDADGIVPTNSILPNTVLSTEPDKATGTWWAIAARTINVGEELTMDYTHTPDFIKKPDPTRRCPL